MNLLVLLDLTHSKKKTDYPKKSEPFEKATGDVPTSYIDTLYDPILVHIRLTPIMIIIHESLLVVCSPVV
jgi:hypothetical protein